MSLARQLGGRGARTGTLTRAPAELIGPHGTVFAIDRDARALAGLQRLAGAIDRPAARIS